MGTVCQCTQDPAPTPPARVQVRPVLIAEPVILPDPPPLPQQTAEGLNLVPVGELPPLPVVPDIPTTAPM